ncbi:hypothetical protein ABOM_001781 [Aspergillus bombycis]|uniref:SGNH hydrolase-type esterase domain-containing protein n=1 Tax=Aspergillus bombycis TaxID=109264 RepID=A0A1F8AD51_9EURO|nr:hypothetical protein ABOM_001781 [Aspergillus bombycis]OGM49676.1 hypothetical protein ABOM_001781 [Aspergillus bombycis]
MGVRLGVSWMLHLLIIGLSLLALTSAIPSGHHGHQHTHLHRSSDLGSRLGSRDGKPFPLRIMPLGASITTGLKSSDKNGYRKVLRQQLRSAGWEVNMVGSLKSGDMKDNDNEGHSGWIIDEVAQEAEKTIPKAPNLILINAGTNDAVKPVHPESAGERMNKMLTRLYDAIPGTTIILSTLLPNKDDKAQVNVLNINEQYRNIAATRIKEGDRLVLAEMSDGFIQVSELVDGTHPTDEGYKKMASVWWAAIQEAESRGLLQKPKDIGESDWADTTCEKKFGSGNSGGKVKTQRGSGWDDGDYKHSSQHMGQIKQIGITNSKEDTHPGVNYAQLVNQGGAHREGALDELVWTRDGLGTWMYPNNGNGKFGNPVKIDVKDNCLARGVHWGDLNNDGLDDFICISREGAMYASMNQGGSPPQFKSIGLVRAAPGGDLNQANVRLGDIDGDGRLDYCLAKNNGDIQCWRNGGQKDAPTKEFGGYWQNLGVVFTGKGMGDLRGVRLVDINGDFRSDWLWLDEEGKVTTYINQRGSGKGSLAPEWRRIGVTHAGMGIKGARDRIKFGQVYPGGGADYVWIESMKNAKTYNHYTHVWKNTGRGGTTLKADGDFYCDWRGTGADDYIWVSPTGRGLLYGNIHKPPVWVPEGPEIFNIGRERKSIHLADFDGDGKCDIWAVNRETGTAEVWINNWNDDIKGGFLTYKGIISGNVKCTEGWGVGLYDIGVRIADLDGDSRADYLCMEPNGRTVGWLNKGINNFQSQGQVKRPQGYDRANHRWADVDGDRRVDFLWVDKFNGNTLVWINKGPIPTAGSSWKWELLDGPRYQGSDRGANLFFPNLGGLGRADMHNVIPRTNIAYTWFNTCPGSDSSAVDDGDPSKEPGLPPYNPPDQPTPTGKPPITPTPTGNAGDEPPKGYYEHWPLDDKAREDAICGDMNQLDKELWNKMDAGSWLITTAGWYQKLALDPNSDFKWPGGEGGAGGISLALSAYQGLKNDGKYVWDCVNPREKCTVDNLSNSDFCRDGRMYRVQALHAVRNLARYLGIVHTVMGEVWNSMSFKTASMVTRYSHSGDSKSDLGPDAGLTLAAGVASIIAGFFENSLAGIPAGVATFGAAAVTTLDETTGDSIRFNTYAELGDKADDIKTAVTNSLDAFYKKLFLTTPPADPNWVTLPTSVPRILQSGYFAGIDSLNKDSPVMPKSEELRKLAAAPLINMLWKKDLVIVVKIDNDSIFTRDGSAYHPCDKNGDIDENQDSTDFKYCNPDGSAFLLLIKDELRNSAHTPKIRPPKGIAELQSEYGFNGHDVARSAYLIQKTTNEWISAMDPGSYFSWIPQTSGADIPAWQMMRWSLPVCDFTGGTIEPTECLDYTKWSQCVLEKVKYVCGRQAGWPEDYVYTPWDYHEGKPYSEASSPDDVVQSLMRG